MSTAFESPSIGVEIELRLLAAFRRAAAGIPAYRTLLAEAGVAADEVRDFDSFVRLCPLLCKQNTFGRFPLAELNVGGVLRDVAEVLTSSGHGGRFSYGVISRREAASSAAFVDAALDAAFAVKSRPTLVINCLPMGVVFTSTTTTVANTSVREDMAVAVIEAIGAHYSQILLVGDPLFLKRLTDHAAAKPVDWRRSSVHALVGGEVFGEHFRSYLAHSLGLSPDQEDQGRIMSSFGVGELGLHLCFETPATIAVRRAAAMNPGLAQDLLGVDTHAGMPLPMIVTFNPSRTFIETANADADGYGAMAISMLDPERSVPLLRYCTGDIVRRLDRDQVGAAMARHGVDPGLAAGLPVSLLALRGRRDDVLPDGSNVAIYKDALYADRQLARQISGAFRLIVSGSRRTMHVQLARGQLPHPGLERGILGAISARVRPARLVLWPHAAFPYGMSLDYQRKFPYYVRGESDAGVAGS